jgi:predicted nucleic acid-binding Zn ribbon protein
VAYLNKKTYLNKNLFNTRKADIQPLKEGIQDLLRAYRIQGKVTQAQVIASWEKIMGKAIALKTKELYFQDRKLFVNLTSAPLKHELVMSKTRVIELINEEIGQDFIQEVVFL